MKKFYLFAFSLITSLAPAQSHSPGIVIGHDPGNTQCLSDSARAEIKKHIAENISMLQSQGRLPLHYASTHVMLDWPMRLRTGLNDYGYHSISAQVDHDSAYPNQLLDYNCGQRTYDNSGGYNHAGTDFFLWPFDWNKLDSGDVEIIAAAPGTIIYKSDGNYDHNCVGSGNWNAVYIQHSDGSVAWYGHMKSGSLTTKGVGQTVALGEFLGKVGSSGNSSGPHLHLEVYDSNNNLNDPFAGPCNNWNLTSWWNNQRPYIDAAINHIATNFDPPVFTPCPNEAIKNERDYFTNTDTIFLMTYYRFLMLGDSVVINIYRPNSSLWSSWLWTNSWSNYNAAYVYWWMIAGSTEPNGQWKFEAVYKNQTYFHNFWIGSAGVDENGSAVNVSLYPNPGNGEFTLQFNDASYDITQKNPELKLCDVLGNEVFKEKITALKTEVHKNDLPAGIYFYSVMEGPQRIAFGKVMVN